MQPNNRTFLSAAKISVLFGLALSLGVGLLAYEITAAMVDKENDERFRSMGHVAQSAINARIKSYTSVLRSAASLFQAEPEITREKFRRFYESLDLQQHYPAIKSFNYVGWVTREGREAFDARMRREDKSVDDGRPPFHIKPPGLRPTYAPLLYVEPYAKWAHLVGNDLNAEPIAQKALQDARDAGNISASGLIVKPMKDKKQIGLAMRLPVYKTNVPLVTIEQRRASYAGSVGIAFDVKELVDGVLDELPVRPVRLSLFNHLQALNPLDENPPQLIYDSVLSASGRSEPDSRDDSSRFHVWLPIDYNGRQWEAHLSVPKAAVYRVGDQSFPLMSMLAGFATTMLLYSSFYLLSSSRARAVELARAMTKELRESKDELLRSHQKLRQLTAHIEHIKEAERKRIAREIHDDLGQNLLALRIEAQLLSSRTSERHPRLHARAEATLGQIDTTIQSVREIINDLRPVVLDLGLNAAVDWQIEEFRRRSGIQCDLVEYHTDIAVDDNCATALFRILQESLTNVRRHAAATWVRVDLSAADGEVQMSIRDNGIGLQGKNHKPGKFGLIGIEERVSMLGGTFSVKGAPGTGTIVEVAIPVGPRPKPDNPEPLKQEQENALA